MASHIRVGPVNDKGLVPIAKKACNKCYGRGYEWVDSKTKKIAAPCKCVQWVPEKEHPKDPLEIKINEKDTKPL